MSRQNLEDLSLSELIEKLKKLFCYTDKKLVYNYQTQEDVNKYLTEIARRTGTFTKNIENETDNIQSELTIEDPITHQKTSLINIASMSDRVKNVLNSNNIFSCLKSLALANKCAHSFDGKIKTVKESFISYYKKNYGPIDESKITFRQPFETIFPEIKTNNLYDLSDVSLGNLESICNLISKQHPENIKKQKKIGILKQLKIPFNVRDENDINYQFQSIVNNKNELINSYLIKKYEEGIQQLRLQDIMFSIKDDYISMIGQLLKTESFSNIEYELVKTPGATKGFEYMLIIDDKELSYYIEVHMPNFIAHCLIKEYGLVVSRTRKTINLGATAVYRRNPEEIEKMRQAKNNGAVSGRRVDILTRELTQDDGSNGGNPQLDGTGDVLGVSTPSRKIGQFAISQYDFQTREISQEKSSFESFLLSKEIHTEEIARNNYMRSNENYPQDVIEGIICENYYSIYESLSEDDKISYILDDFNKTKNGDAFDRVLIEQINLNFCDMDTIAKLLIKSGIGNVILCDREGAVYEGRPGLNETKKQLALITNATRKRGTLADDVLEGADVFIGVSAANVLKPEYIAKMAEKPIVFAMANPIPEILPEAAEKAGVAVIGTGRSDYPNQINNVLAFPGIFRGALDVRASDINDEMKIAAANAIAGLISWQELAPDYVVPSPFDERVSEAVAVAVAKAAKKTGVARI